MIGAARKFICVLSCAVLLVSWRVIGINGSNVQEVLATAIPNVWAEQEAMLSTMPKMSSVEHQEIYVEKNRQRALDLLNEAMDRIVDSDYFGAERVLENLLMQFNYFTDIEEVVLVLMHFVNLMLGRSFESTENIELIFMNKFSQSQYVPYVMYIYIIQISQKISASLSTILQTDLDNIAKAIKKLSTCDQQQHYYLQACRYQKKVMKKKLWNCYKMAKFYSQAKEPIATMMTCLEYWDIRGDILFDKYDEDMKALMKKANKKILLREGHGNSCPLYAKEDDPVMVIIEGISETTNGVAQDVQVVKDQIKQTRSEIEQLLLFFLHNEKIWKYHLEAREIFLLELNQVGGDIIAPTTGIAKVITEINSPMSLERTMGVLKSEMMEFGRHNAVLVAKYVMKPTLPMWPQVFDWRKSVPRQGKQVFDMGEQKLQVCYSFGN